MRGAAAIVALASFSASPSSVALRSFVISYSRSRNSVSCLVADGCLLAGCYSNCLRVLITSRTYDGSICKIEMRIWES